MKSSSTMMVFFLLVCLITVGLNNANANLLRHQQSKSAINEQAFQDMKERVLHPNIPETVRGKTWDELVGVDHTQQKQQQKQHQRKTQGLPTFGSPAYSYFALYDEFGPAFATLGDTAGLRGTIYDNDARLNGLVDEYVEGSLDATCSVVNSKGALLCTYEFFFLDTKTGFLATLVATGSVSTELFQPNLLLIEAAGDDFADDKKHGGGLVSITYTAGGDQPVIEIDIIF